MENIEAYGVLATSGKKTLMSTVVGTTTTTTNTNSSNKNKSTVIGGDYVKGESSTWLGGAGGGGVESGTPPASNNGGGGGGGLRHGQKKRRFGRNKRLSMSSMRLPFSSDSHPSQLVPARVSFFFFPLNRIHSYVINYYSLLPYYFYFAYSLFCFFFNHTFK